jgi:hypothetical protein
VERDGSVADSGGEAFACELREVALCESGVMRCEENVGWGPCVRENCDGVLFGPYHVDPASCEALIPLAELAAQPPMLGGVELPRFLNVQVNMAQDGGRQPLAVLLNRVNPESCGSSHGWYATLDPARIFLCPMSCDASTADALLGCESIWREP